MSNRKNCVLKVEFQYFFQDVFYKCSGTTSFAGRQPMHDVKTSSEHILNIQLTAH